MRHEKLLKVEWLLKRLLGEAGPFSDKELLVMPRGVNLQGVGFDQSGVRFCCFNDFALMNW